MRAAIAQHFSLARITSKQYTKHNKLRVLEVGVLVWVARLELTLRRKCAGCNMAPIGRKHKRGTGNRKNEPAQRILSHVKVETPSNRAAQPSQVHCLE